MRRPTAGSTPVALFPFLAVLLCTMGVLVALLMVAVRNVGDQAQARAAEQREALAAAAAKQAEAQRVAAAATRQRQQERRRQIEDLHFRREMLEQSAAATRADLDAERKRLGHLEEHARRLEDALAALEEQLARPTPAAPHDDHAQTDAAQLQAQADRLREEIDDLRKDAAQPRGYAIIPYAGPSGTQRRPVYLECLADRVVIQPEGTVLNEADFPPDVGSDNPLAAALRSTRAHLAARYGDAAPEPYPLLVVRPPGAGSYHAARVALQAWESEFGYELVPAQMRLEFGEPDTALAAAQQRAIDEARERLHRRRMLRASAGQPAGEDLVLVASPRRGGFEPVGGNLPTRRLGVNQTPGDSPINDGGAVPPEKQAAENAAGRPPISSATRGSSAEPLANQRGRDWALNPPPRATPYERPIVVHVYADRIVLPPEPGSQDAAVTIRRQDADGPAIEALVDAVEIRRQGWGVAGAHAYWRPTMQTLVHPGAGPWFHTLEQLLRGSGLDLRRIER